MAVDPLFLLTAAALITAGIAIGVAVARGRELELVRATGLSGSVAGAESVVLDTEDLLAMADWMAIGLLRVDRTGRIVMANEVAHRFLGRGQGSMTGLTTMEAFVDHRMEELAREAGSRGSAQRELAFGAEPQLTMIVRARRVGRDGELWVILEDVSELRRLQRIRTEFIGNLSHELRTPLTTVRLLIEGLTLELERTELPARVRDSIVKIDVETGHLVQMVNELLDLARIEQGETQLRLEDVDVGRVVEATLDRLRLYAERHGVRLRGEMPGTDAERTVRGDEERLGQVLINLLHNAVKFSQSGEEVVVRIRSEPAELLIEVEDHGVGIPRADLDRIFERFYKVDRARQRGGGGTGLGLAIARHIVERHGGRIWVESVEGKGSRFLIALPRPAEPSAGA